MKQLSAADNIENVNSPYIYYRLKTILNTNRQKYSAIVRLSVVERNTNTVSIYPNPAKNAFNLSLSNPTPASIKVEIVDETGKLMRSVSTSIVAGTTSLSFTDFSGWHKGIYMIKILRPQETITKRIILGN